MAKKVKFEEVADKFFEASRELRKECIKYIKSVVKKYKTLDFSDCEYNICVPYDGGNHPEYASNCFSDVYSVSLNDKGNIVLEIEDCDEYDIEDVPTEQVYDLADYIKNVYIASINK